MKTRYVSVETMIAIEAASTASNESIRKEALTQLKERCEKALAGDDDGMLLHIEEDEDEEEDDEDDDDDDDDDDKEIDMEAEMQNPMRLELIEILDKKSNHTYTPKQKMDICQAMILWKRDDCSNTIHQLVEDVDRKSNHTLTPKQKCDIADTIGDSYVCSDFNMG